MRSCLWKMPRPGKLPAGFEQMRRMFQAGLGQLGPAKHAGYLLRALGVLHAANLGLGAPALFGLFNQEVLVPKRRNLRQMSNAQYLLTLRQCFELFPDCLSSPSADSDIDLVEDQGARQNRLLLSS